MTSPIQNRNAGDRTSWSSTGSAGLEEKIDAFFQSKVMGPCPSPDFGNPGSDDEGQLTAEGVRGRDEGKKPARVPIPKVSSDKKSFPGAQRPASKPIGDPPKHPVPIKANGGTSDAKTGFAFRITRYWPGKLDFDS